MNTATRIGLAAAAVVVLTFAGMKFLPGSGLFGGPPAATCALTLEPNLHGQACLSPGRYEVDPTLPVIVTVEVPDGWSAGGNWIVIGPKGKEAPHGMAVRFYTAQNLYRNPLSPGEGLVVPLVGPSVDDLVNAMVNHPDWTTTGPTPITIDGYAGQVVHVTLPAGTSDTTPFFLSVDANGGQAWGWVAGQLFDIYVVDVGGKRLVIDAFHYPGTSAADLAAQRAVLDSIQLAP
jgi:hypothetical protein